VPQEQPADDRDDDKLLDQLARQVLHRAVDQLRAVISGDDLDTGRKAPLQFRQLGPDGLDRLACVLALAQDDDAARDLAFAVQLGDAAAHLGADLDRGDIAQRDGHAGTGDLERDRAKIIDAAQIARRADHIFGFAQFEDGPAGLLIGTTNGIDGLGVGDAERGKPRRVEQHLIFLHHPADARHLGDAG
jgi:hypothetical protein